MIPKHKKIELVAQLSEALRAHPDFYIADFSRLSAPQMSQLRITSYDQGITIKVVKNTLLKRALEAAGYDVSSLEPVLEGPSAVLYGESATAPARFLKKVHKEYPQVEFKGAHVYEGVYLGKEQLNTLASLKSREELIGDIILALQAPMRNVVGALQSAGQKVAGILKTLSEKEQQS